VTGDMTIMRAGREHIPVLVPLFDGYRMFYEQSSDLEGGRAFLEQRLLNDESVIFLAVDGEKGLGFTQLFPSFSSVSMRRIWILNDLFVAPSARGRGVGEALMQRAEQWAVETGAIRLELSTATDNFTAQRLYERVGYKRDTVFYKYLLALETQPPKDDHAAIQQ
jgi:GNAT superfamily N-acetyltransferase